MQQRCLQQVGVSVSLNFLIHGLIIANLTSNLFCPAPLLQTAHRAGEKSEGDF
jgi:hypothetical protein